MERSLVESVATEEVSGAEAFGNARRALQYVNRVTRRDVPVTGKMIKSIHGRCTKNLLPGVPELMRAYVEEVEKKICPCGCGVKCLPAVIEAIGFSMYAMFRIHPFEDGNGRTARLVGDLILKRFGFRPIIIWPSQGDEYIQSLEAVHRSGNLAHFELFLAGRLLERYKPKERGVGNGEIIDELGVLIGNKKNEIEAQNATPCFD